MNIHANQLCKSVISTNLLDLDYDVFMTVIDISLDLLLGE